jgi:ribose 5-phosphate isomerase B
MRIAVAADERVGIAGVLVEELRRRGHEVSAHGALASGERVRGGEGAAQADERRSSQGLKEREDWAWCSETAAHEVAEGRAQQAVVCCWTGTGASIAANKVMGIRAALCADAATAAGARRWNDANVLALSLRSTSEAELREILDAWFSCASSTDAADRANVMHLAEIERRPD